ncbi:MAG: threonine synthase [Candidatus Bipolaricaulota bacterium]|nr:threonine synthase [Candidatus Bipolaricaulota bacterium]MDW8140741.1 threonine synthase [Candidatus Bipolaricaulota bacterium]
MNVRCADCGQLFSLTTRLWRCECGGVFELSERPPFNKDKIDTKASTLWRYRAMLPAIQPENIISLGEGWTPIVPAQAYGISCLAKLEFLAPTGSFKDRGTTVLVSFLKELGVTEVVEDSSGNAAASLAAYCARAQIRCKIFVPAQASPAKLAQIRIYGAELCPIEGPRENSSLAAQQAAQQAYYASHVYNPLILAGTKTFAYEVWEQLGRAPDHLVFPVGHGTLLLGAYLGFCDLLEAQLIERLPKLHAVQSEGYAPLYRIYRENLTELPQIVPQPTIAEGIRILRPVRWRAMMSAIRETGGSVVTVSESEILAAQRELAHQGLYVEPTAAVPIAGLQSLMAVFQTNDQILAPLTGSGLKALALP